MMMNTVRTLVVTAALLTGGALPLTAQVTIHRDPWGVPHIIADTEEAGFYGLGYAQGARPRTLRPGGAVALRALARLPGPDRVCRIARVAGSGWPPSTATPSPERTGTRPTSGFWLPGAPVPTP